MRDRAFISLLYVAISLPLDPDRFEGPICGREGHGKGRGRSKGKGRNRAGGRGRRGRHVPRSPRSGGPALCSIKIMWVYFEAFVFHGYKINKSTTSSESFKTIIHASRPIPINFHTRTHTHTHLHRQPRAPQLLPPLGGRKGEGEGGNLHRDKKKHHRRYMFVFVDPSERTTRMLYSSALHCVTVLSLHARIE